jgi:hypothetical protein
MRHGLRACGRHGEPVVEDAQQPVHLSLPTAYEAFDTLFRDQGSAPPGPRIDNSQMGAAISMVAGQPGSVLIPGLNLWRNTMVTIGSQSADRIRVLPDKAGIIADFSSVQLPWNRRRGSAPGPVCALVPQEPTDESWPAPERLGELARAAPLRVWTSEGQDTSAQPVCIVYSQGGASALAVPAATARPAPSLSSAGDRAADAPAEVRAD